MLSSNMIDQTNETTFDFHDSNDAVFTSGIVSDGTSNAAPELLDTDFEVLAGGQLWLDSNDLALDPDGDDVTFELGGVSAQNGSVAIGSGQGYIVYQPEEGFSGTDEVTVTLTDGVNTTTETFEVAVAPVLTESFAFNIGSDTSYTNPITGKVYAADTTGVGNMYDPGNVNITNAAPDELYGNHAWSAEGLNYAFDVADGVYRVTLNFAEIYEPTQEVGKRVFDIAIEDILLRDNFDLLELGDANVGSYMNFEVVVTDGELNIDLTGEVQNAMLSGLSVDYVGALPEIETVVAVADIFDIA